MIHFPVPQDVDRLSPPPTATEYRLLADLLLDQIDANPVQNGGLNTLAHRLFVLAVQAEQYLAQA